MTGLYATVLVSRVRSLPGRLCHWQLRWAAAGKWVWRSGSFRRPWRCSSGCLCLASELWRPSPHHRVHSSAPCTNRVAWQLAIFSGLHSLCFYTIVTWLPSILQAHGLSPTDADFCSASLRSSAFRRTAHADLGEPPAGPAGGRRPRVVSHGNRARRVACGRHPGARSCGPS